MSLWMLGYPTQALASSAKTFSLACELHYSRSQFIALHFKANLHRYRREWSAVYERADSAMQIEVEFGSRVYWHIGMVQQGLVLAMRSQHEEGVAQIRRAIGAMRALGSKAEEPQWLADLAEAYSKSGQVTEGLAAVEEALALVDGMGPRYCEAELHRLKGELLLQQTTPDPCQAEGCFQQALQVARRQAAKSSELRAAMSLARLWQSQGKHQDAYDLLAPIYG